MNKPQVLYSGRPMREKTCKLWEMRNSRENVHGSLRATNYEYPKLRLFYENKPVHDSTCIESFPDDATIVALLPVLGGTTPCDMCYYSPGNYSCSDCGQVYCKDCSVKVHKHPHHQHHSPKFTPESEKNPESNDTPVLSQMSDSSQSASDSDYGFTDSPRGSLLFEQATMTMTLAEKFNLTKFRLPKASHYCYSRWKRLHVYTANR